MEQQKMAMQELVTMSNRASVLGAISPSDRYTFGTVIPACMYAEAKAIMLRSEEFYVKIGSTTASDATLNRVKDLFASLTNRYNVYMNRSDLVTKEDLIKIYGNFTVKNSAIDNFYNFYQTMPDAAKSQYGLIKIYDDPYGFGGNTLGYDATINMNNAGFKGGVIDVEKGQFTWETYVMAHELGHVVDAYSEETVQINNFSSEQAFQPMELQSLLHQKRKSLPRYTAGS
ncbi:TPA: hypothetical protein ACHWCH_001056 [Streptococcus suis]